VAQFSVGANSIGHQLEQRMLEGRWIGKHDAHCALSCRFHAAPIEGEDGCGSSSKGAVGEQPAEVRSAALWSDVSGDCVKDRNVGLARQAFQRGRKTAM